VFKRFVAYYLPFDAALSFQMPWIWQHGKTYAFRNGIACAALVGISLAAKSYQLPVAAMATHALAIITIFFTTVFTAAALDPRAR
jgi:hypothetical protein